MRKNAFIISCMFLALAWGGKVIASAEADSRFPETAAILQILYADQLSASRTHWAYAQKAHAENHFDIECLFSALAASESVHVDNFQKLLSDLGVEVEDDPESEISVSSTKFNLKITLNIDLAGIDQKYLLLIEKIKPEGHESAIGNITYAWQAAQQYRELVNQAYSALKSFLGLGKSPDEFFVCWICGSTVADIPREQCPICKGPISNYEEATPKWRFYDAINDNELLTDEEKACAKRIFDLIYYHQEKDSDIAIDRNIFDSDLYKKWGLGPKREFSIEEQIYIMGLLDMAAMWEEYNSINPDDLDESQKQYLEEMREKYGPGPLNLREEIRKKEGKLSEAQEAVLDLIEALCGHEEFGDVELIFFAARQPKL